MLINLVFILQIYPIISKKINLKELSRSMELFLKLNCRNSMMEKPKDSDLLPFKNNNKL